MTDIYEDAVASNCQWCGRLFEGDAIFCSEECEIDADELGHINQGSKKVDCEMCGTEGRMSWKDDVVHFGCDHCGFEYCD